MQCNTIHASYAMLSGGIPWNMPRVTCIFRIHMPKSSENLREFPKTSETLPTRFSGTFIKKRRVMKILENRWQSSETFGKLRRETVLKWFPMFL